MSGTQDKFTEIYESHAWGSKSRSGPGSEPKRNVKYRAIVEGTLRSHSIASVVDIGCGDWAFSQNIDWGQADYTGVDIVPGLIAKLNEDFGNDRRRFIVANLAEDPLPEADLCIIKDVLQHLPNASVHRFLENQLPRFRYALITNDARRTPLTHLIRPWRRRKANIDIADGGIRSLRLTNPPFNLKAKRLAWMPSFWGQTILEKEVLFWQRDGG